MQATTPARHIHTLARTHMRLSHHASLPPFRAQSNRKSTHANADTQQTKARHRHTGNQLRSNIQIKLQMQWSRPSTPARLCLTRVANLLRIARLTLFCFSEHLYGAWGSLVVTRMQLFFFCLQPHCLCPAPSLGAVGRNMLLRYVDCPFLSVVIILEGALLQLVFRVMSTGRRAWVGTFQTAEMGGGKDCVIVVRNKKGALSSGG